jgi:hypothetical protein
VLARAEDLQRLALAAGRVTQPVARLQDQPQLHERVRDVGVVGTLDRLISGERPAAGALGRREVAVGAQRDRPLVLTDGRQKRIA